MVGVCDSGVERPHIIPTPVPPPFLPPIFESVFIVRKPPYCASHPNIAVILSKCEIITLDPLRNIHTV